MPPPSCFDDTFNCYVLGAPLERCLGMSTIRDQACRVARSTIRIDGWYRVSCELPAGVDDLQYTMTNARSEIHLHHCARLQFQQRRDVRRG